MKDKVSERILEFELLGKEVKAIQNKMYNIAVELEPVEYIIEKHNPKYIELFNMLKDIHGHVQNDSLHSS